MDKISNADLDMLIHLARNRRLMYWESLEKALTELKERRAKDEPASRTQL